MHIGYLNSFIPFQSSFYHADLQIVHFMRGYQNTVSTCKLDLGRKIIQKSGNENIVWSKDRDFSDFANDFPQRKNNCWPGIVGNLCLSSCLPIQLQDAVVKGLVNMQLT